jgi:PAS domain S-box-containing protein
VKTSPGKSVQLNAASPQRDLARLRELRELLQLAASADSVDEALDRIARLIERSIPSAKCSLMLSSEDGTVLRPVAAPSLSDEYLRYIATVPIAEGAGSCGTAAYRGIPVICEDVEVDPLMVDYRAVKREHGLAAVWSYPMVTGAGRVLGTFANYRTEPGAPDADEIELVANAAQLATLYIERALAERLRQSQERSLASILRHAPEAIVRLDLEGRHLFANPAAARLAGRPAEELIGKTTRELGLEPAAADAFDQSLRAAETGLEPATVEIQLGATRLSVVSVPEHNERGELASFVVVARDITEQRTLEDRIRQSEKMESLGRLAGGIAHDFNNILAAILGYTELLLDDLPPGSEAADNLDQVLHASRRARDLVKQILAFSRKSDVIVGPIDIRFAVRDALRLLRASIPATVQVIEKIADTPLIVLSEVGQISQVVLNLGSNAEFAMRARGHGTLHITLEPANIGGVVGRALGVAPGRYVRLVVRDDGDGIREDVVSKIFEPFFTTKAVGEGTGMGLAVVHGIVTAHGGVHRVESAPGRGTTFEILLPRASTPVTTAAPLPRRQTVGSGRVLVVDDEQSIASMLARALPRQGFEVTSFTSPVEALQRFTSDPFSFDVVVTDRTMPQMTGEHLIRELLAIRPDLPVVLSSGQGHTAADDLANTQVVHLAKPFDAHDLLEAIGSAMRA